MERRSLFLGLAALAAAPTATSGPAEAQPGWAPPPGHRRRRRCWVETRQVRYRDRWGRLRRRTVRQQVCR
ncbi:MAG: hypothetical protein WCP77_18090 [Roseococcus sp.]